MSCSVSLAWFVELSLLLLLKGHAGKSHVLKTCSINSFYFPSFKLSVLFYHAAYFFQLYHNTASKGQDFTKKNQYKSEGLGGNSLAVQQLRPHRPMLGVWVQSLAKELRSHILHSQKNPQNIKKKQYCNKFSKDFKNDPHQKKEKK